MTELGEMRKRYDRRLTWAAETMSREIKIDFDRNPFRSLNKRIVVACVGARTGSYLLAERLLQHGAVITEGFLESRIFNMCRRLNIISLEEYCTQHLVENAINGIFGFKGGFGSLATLAFAGEFPEYRQDWKYIHLSRSDTLKQAISFVIATESKSWRSFKPSAKILTEEYFDAARIAREIKSISNQNAVWEETFKLFGINPLRIVYEDLAADPAGVAATVAAYVGLDGPAITEPRFVNPPMERQASEINARWEARFLEERGS